MSAHHTPGPWSLDKHGTIWAHGDGVDDGVCLVMDVFDGDKSHNSKRSEMANANRHLIATAPELLTALKECALEIAQIRNRKLTASEQAALDNARVVITKATGGAA